MKRDFPTYTTIRYYYNDKTTSEYEYSPKKYNNSPYKFIEVCGSLILTEYDDIFFNQSGGAILYETERDFIVPHDWGDIETVKYALNYQPYDFNDMWLKGHAMYSKELWRLVLSDMRNLKIDIIQNKIDKNKLNWIKY